MFDEPPSLPMRAAIASLLGGLFGIGLILATHTTAQAQGAATAVESTAEEPGATLRRIGDPGLRSLRGTQAAPDSTEPIPRGLRFEGKGSDVPGGLRWQVARLPGLRSEGEVPRSRDLVSVGMQWRY